jgi:hypothetical protein
MIGINQLRSVSAQPRVAQPPVRTQMTLSAPTGRPRQLIAVANMCAVAAFFALLCVAEWVPGLLPYSPNFALSSSVAVRSATFPVVFLTIATVALITSFLLRRIHRLALVSFASLWILVVGSATYSCAYLRESCGTRGVLSIAFLFLCGAVMFRAIWRNWPVRP